ncbi:MAG: hypothetical protein RBT47_10995 [Anaerolineae bacterium]|jgi:hypothetical protein|nr:hypothetical protein [Anaerolineae bacterium]
MRGKGWFLAVICCLVIASIFGGCTKKEASATMELVALVKSKEISREELEDLAWHVRNAVEQDHKIQPFSTEEDLALYEYWMNAEAIYCMGSVEMYAEQLDASGNPIFEMGRATLYFQFEGETLYALDDDQKVRTVYVEARPVYEAEQRTWEIVDYEESVGVLPVTLSVTPMPLE